MASKTICIKNDVYNRLVSLKREDESFSDFLQRLIDIVESKTNNRETILKEVFGSGKEDIPDGLLDSFHGIRGEIDRDFMHVEPGWK
ncbi:MAG: antitoxin VapB family protein [Candidatus Sigynarchaeota archaeon]